MLTLEFHSLVTVDRYFSTVDSDLRYFRPKVTINSEAAYAIFYWPSVQLGLQNVQPQALNAMPVKTPLFAAEREVWVCAPIRAAGWKREHCTGLPRSGPQLGAHAHSARSAAKPRGQSTGIFALSWFAWRTKLMQNQVELNQTNPKEKP
jgi:hypothetical protein